MWVKRRLVEKLAVGFSVLWTTGGHFRTWGGEEGRGGEELATAAWQWLRFVAAGAASPGVLPADGDEVDDGHDDGDSKNTANDGPHPPGQFRTLLGGFYDNRSKQPVSRRHFACLTVTVLFLLLLLLLLFLFSFVFFCLLLFFLFLFCMSECVHGWVTRV